MSATQGPNPIAAQISRTFRSDRLIYRSIEHTDEEDIDLAWKLNNDPWGLVSTNTTLPVPPTREDMKAVLKHLSSDFMFAGIACLDRELHHFGLEPRLWESKTTDRFGKPKPVPIGMFSIKNRWRSGAIHHRSCEVSLEVLPDYQGQGYGTEMMAWMLDYSFDTANLHRVRLGVFGWNAGAIRVYEKLGFTKVGNEREALWAAGRWWNELYYDMLEDEWRADRERVWRTVVRREGELTQKTAR